MLRVIVADIATGVGMVFNLLAQGFLIVGECCVAFAWWVDPQRSIHRDDDF